MKRKGWIATGAGVAGAAVLGSTLFLTSGPTEVPAGGDIQAAILQAQCGDVVTLQANANYTGSFVLPNKGCEAQPIVIQSSRYAEIPIRAYASLRPTAEVLAMMPHLRSGHPSEPVFKTAPGAKGWKLLGLDMAPAGGGR